MDQHQCFDEIYLMLERLAMGDPAARLSLATSDQQMLKLASMLNNVAESMEQMVDYSHETAIGLCEHYDTLNRIAEGDLSARANENSANDVMAKLGILINRGADKLREALEDIRKADIELRVAMQQALII